MNKGVTSKWILTQSLQKTITREDIDYLFKELGIFD